MKNLPASSFLKTACCLLALGCCQLAANAQSHVLPAYDTTFNYSGTVRLLDIVDFKPAYQAIQPDGKILIGGYGRDAATDDFDGILYRMGTDGNLDYDFGVDGYLVLDIDGTDDLVVDFVLQPDNKIMLVLQSNHRLYFVRLLANGTYDPSYDGDGRVLVPASATEYFKKMQVQPDGKIVLSGYQDVTSTKHKGVVRRYNADGTSDNTFGVDGYVSVVIDASKNFELTKCVLQPDGKILATGTLGVGAGSGFPLIRLNTDGTFDNTFSGDGIYYNALGTAVNTAIAESLAVTADGNIYVGGASPSGTENMITVLCVKSTGNINGAFGTFGISRVPLSIYGTAKDMIIQPDGKILVAGYSFVTASTTGVVWVRMNANGSPDNTFGDALGRYYTYFPIPYSYQTIKDMGFTPDGRLVSTTWLNQTLQIQDPASKATCYIFRFITDLTVKAEEPSPIFQETSLFPNPVGESETLALTYYLENACQVSVALYDITGREIATLVSAQQHSAGQQNERLTLPGNLVSGTYFAVLSTEKGFKAIKFLKQ